jgi:hypothetical protein
MSKTYKDNVSRIILPELKGKKGWQGEKEYAQEGRAFINKQVAKHSKRLAKKQIEREFNYD